MNDLSVLLESLDQLLAHAEQDVASHAGNQMVCQLHKDGRVTGGLKYDEGRLVAYATLRRSLSKVEAPTLAEIAASIESECARWQQGLDIYQNAERPSVPWVAYYQGGTDAIEEVVQLFLPDR